MKKLYVIISGILCVVTLSTTAQQTNFHSGSFIVDMGVLPQTNENALRPYGMVYDLVSNYDVPVYWIIKPNKLKDGIDFNYNSYEFKGGPFVIAAENRTAAVNARIAYWTSTGVVGIITTSAISLPVAQKITSVPRWTLDLKSGAIAQKYLENAGIPLVYTNWQEPHMLNNCNDIFVLPHADPKWASHAPLLTWNSTNRGSIWASCHGVSMLENMFNPSAPAQQTNFLALNAAGVGSNALVDFKSHKDGSVPYVNTAFPAEQVMQFLGSIDGATTNGSESIYLPALGGGWRPSTKVVVYDPTHIDIPAKSAGKAALLVYGRGFGDPNRGWVMYEAGHSHTGGGEDGIAAQRAFFNFSYMATLEKGINISVTGIQSVMVSSGSYALSADISQNNPTGPYTVQWSSTCGGVFSAPNALNTNYSPPTVVNPTECIITVKVTDACGRTRFFTQNITVTSGPRPPIANPDSITVTPDCINVNQVIDINVLANDVEPDGQPMTVNAVTGANGIWSINPDQTVRFLPAPGFYGTTTANYSVCDNTAPSVICNSSTITVNIGINGHQPVAVNDSYTILEDSIMRFQVLANDGAGAGGGSLKLAGIALQPSRGKASINPDNTISYVPVADNRLVDSFYYRITNASGYSATAKVTVNIIADGCSPGYYQVCVPGPNPISVIAAEDTYLNDKNRDNNNTNNYGSDTVIVVDREATDLHRSLIRFNLPALTCNPAIQPVITGATLKLYKVAGGSGLPVDVYRATSTWNEDQASWNNRLTGIEWTTRGGDFDAALISSANVNGVGQYNWDVSSLVSNWYSNPTVYPNNGMLLKTTEGGGNRDPRFVSSESTSGLMKPTLEISYTIPQLCLLIPTRAPMSMPDTAVTNSLIPVTAPVTANDYFSTAGAVTVTIIPGSISSGAAIVSGNNIVYTPNPLFSGIATLQYRVVNNITLLADTAVLYVVVSFPPPIANNDSSTILSGSYCAEDVFLNDVDPLGLGVNFSLITYPANGTCTVAGTTITYQAPANFIGRDTITYRIFNLGTGLCNQSVGADTGYYIITVNNRAPLPQPDTAFTNPCSPMVLDVMQNDTDPEGGVLTINSISAVTPVTAGTANIVGSFIRFTPNPGFVGTSAVFSYTVADDAVPPLVSSPINVVVNFTSLPNNLPDAVDDMANGLANSDVYINVLANDSDADNDSLSISLGGGILTPAHGTISIMPNGMIRYIPATNFAGYDVFEYRLNDHHLGISGGSCTTVSSSTIARVNLSITNVFVILYSEFESFTGLSADKKNKLYWTVNEIKGSADYYIERSTDNRVFTTIGHIAKANVEAAGKVSYQFTDASPVGGTNYYRIRYKTALQPVNYSTVLKLKNNMEPVQVDVYPVPFTSKLTCRFTLARAEKVEVSLLSAEGKLLIHVKHSGTAGMNNVQLQNLETYAPGSYYIKVIRSEGILMNKLIKFW